jgi:hypothetical protein
LPQANGDVRSDLLNVLEAPGSGHQMLGYFEFDLATDRDLCLDQRIESDRDGPLDRILNGNYAEVCVAAFGQRKYIPHVRDRNEVHLGTKLTTRGLVAERPIGSQKGNSNALFERSGR